MKQESPLKRPKDQYTDFGLGKSNDALIEDAILDQMVRRKGVKKRQYSQSKLTES